MTKLLYSILEQFDYFVLERPNESNVTCCTAKALKYSRGKITANNFVISEITGFTVSYDEFNNRTIVTDNLLIHCIRSGKQNMTEELYALLHHFTYFIMDIQTREASVRMGVRDFKLSNEKIVAGELVIDDVSCFRVTMDSDGWIVILMDYIRIYCNGGLLE